jgi:two-component system, chemotaxis family, response regulator Rcp1
MLLLIEDNRADVFLLKEALKEARKEYPVPVQLYTVADGRTALAFLHHEGCYHHAPRPDLIVLDLHLPGPSGHEVLAQVKSEAALKCIPVVVFTSSTAPEDIEHSYALGANAYVCKAAELEEFFATIKDLVGFWCQRATLPSAAAVSSGDRWPEEEMGSCSL